MLHLLAQTQPSMKYWTPADWTVFFTALAGFIAAVFAGWKSIRADARAGEAKTAAFANTTRISDVSEKVENNRTKQNEETDRKIQMAMTAPAAPQVVVVPPIVTPQRADLERTPQAPTPETIQSGFNDANKPE